MLATSIFTGWSVPLRAAAIAAILSSAALSPALAMDPYPTFPAQRAGWGSGLIAVSLIDSVRKDGPFRGPDPAFKGFAMAPVAPEPLGSVLSAGLPSQSITLALAQSIVQLGER